ncbi:Chromatin assembly factor 1 subunit B-like [Homarus americanus]|uniref:Chromatin assembly factor 1 subunit B-like n=1 Tax=Homarus americanus TaxID=6706 RepID=A0A8J5MXZ6_HOMAM|nr:Chromatin assembly factor 1 subunit B-like [Homarus americanus]
MKCTIPEISWHNRDPVLSLDIQPNPQDGIYRLATAGTDTHIVIWQLCVLDNGGVSVEALSDLTRHNRAVNAVRFSPDGEILASADDEAAVILWKKQDSSGSVDIFVDDSEKENKEHWTILKMLRGHLEDVYDICWSKCSQFLITGSVDNSAILWDVGKGKNIGLLNDHKGFVQGVAWDPQGQYVATLCSDRLFYDDTLKSFCRRLSFSPDGELLLTPSGIVEEDNGKVTNVTYVFSRHAPSKPVLYLPTKDKYTLAVRFCPILFELRPIPREEEDDQKDEPQEPWQEYLNLFNLPYRMIFAVATQNAVLLYDTQQPVPFAKVSNIHYTRLSDVAWSFDGRILVVSSTDGYCSLVSFSEGELGIPYRKGIEQNITKDVDSTEFDVKETRPVLSSVCESASVEVENEQLPSSQLTKNKAVTVKRTGESSKPGKRISLITLSGPSLKSDENTLTPKPESTQLPSNTHLQGELMDVDEAVKKKFEGDTQSPSKTTRDGSPAKTPSGGSKTPRRVPLITLSSPKGKKSAVSDFR